ncbi:MAG: Glu/Leu/Phe/Val dehydrogenase [Chlamydiales bacterium]|nr:Glu/Leu/Phe/Val dehydrogenase [Chlamydiales bacterium]
MALILEEALTLEEIAVEGYERVVKVSAPSVGLQAIICIHTTVLGPALGGTRIYPYATFEAALEDVKRLSRGMTYKSAVADASWGGGKSVIIHDAKKGKSESLLMAFGEAVNRLNGQYICAEDIGCTPSDMMTISKATPFVVGLVHPRSSGDPGPFTAWGTFRGIQSVIKKITGSDSLEGKRVAIQGLGSVGARLAELLFWHGAKLILADIDQERAARLGAMYSAEVVSTDEILSTPCDVVAPCAMGGILNATSIAKLRCLAVAGCANNQLLKDTDADLLRKRGILYAPDFVINAGGLINVSHELLPEGYNPSSARDKTDKIYDQLLAIYAIADQNRISTHAAAIALGDYRLQYGLGKREVAPCFHHAKIS